jgi:hypothetical protein
MPVGCKATRAALQALIDETPQEILALVARRRFAKGVDNKAVSLPSHGLELLTNSSGLGGFKSLCPVIALSLALEKERAIEYGRARQGGRHSNAEALAFDELLGELKIAHVHAVQKAVTKYALLADENGSLEEKKIALGRLLVAVHAQLDVAIQQVMAMLDQGDTTGKRKQEEQEAVRHTWSK